MDPEEAMWKHFYEKFQEQEKKSKETKNLTVHDIRIQELDGGFFEKFGSLLKEQADQAAEDERTTDGGKDGKESEENGGPEMEPLLEENDSEPEETDKEELISEAMGWNIEELYSEILYELLHTVGSDVTNEEREALFLFLQEAFRLDSEKHSQLLETAQSKEAPNILLNVEVIEAKDLTPKDANGLSDPFCTLYLNSANTHRYNTSVKSETLSPIWEEHFSLPVVNPSEDILHVEVWDFDPAETVREKMMKIGEVKGVRGLRKLMKEIAVTASTGKHDNELVGSVQIPLKNIPASGQLYWCGLERKNKGKKQGDIKIRLSFSSEKNPQVAFQEHRHLLRILLLHELEDAKTFFDLLPIMLYKFPYATTDTVDGQIVSRRVEPYHWCDSFQDRAQTILTQHLGQCGMCPTDVALAQWAEYISVHVDHPLSFKLFSILLEKLVKPIKQGFLSDENIKIFWDSAKKLLPSCLNAIRRIRKLSQNCKTTVNQLSSVLSILSQLRNLDPPESFDLFPSSVYGWLLNSVDMPNCDILGTVRDAVTQGAADWYLHILDVNNTNDSSEDTRLNNVIKVVQLVRTDLQKAIEFYDKIFQQNLEFTYAKTLYRLYEEKVSELVEPIVTDVCKNLKPVWFNERMGNVIEDDDPLSKGTKLFELYLILQRFSVLGVGLCPNELESLKIKNFHFWFYSGVTRWLEIAQYKALQRINKAVELDQLEPVDNTVKYSSSAVDTLAIFYQIKIFWKQLSWPDVEGSYSFVAKIIDDICRCSVYYADEMSKKVEGLGESENVYQKKFEVTNEWCLAINNIDYVRQSIEPFVGELGMEEIITSMANFRSQTAADHCRETLNLVIDNAVETVGNKILDLLETVADKMVPAINRFLLEGAELINQDNNSVDRLMKYLDDNLVTLHSELNADNFDRILAIIWENLSRTMYNLVENNLEKRRPPSFFANLHGTLKILVGFFRQDENSKNSEILKQIEKMLELHGMETTELIHQYYIERLNEQNAMEDSNFGQITVRALFGDDILKIQIMNARNLKPMDSNGTCDPYVKIHLLPEDKFFGVTKPKTKTQKKTLYPLFDETFIIPLTKNQINIQDGIVLFVIKDQDFLGMNELIGEAYLAFSEIKNSGREDIEEFGQIHLKIGRPTNLDSKSLRAIENRQGDKTARDFVKKQKAKIASVKV